MSTDLMVKFTLSAQQYYSQTFDYDIGYIKNPSVASFVQGFNIVIDDSNGNVIYSVTDGSQVIIQPGSITN